MDTELRNSGPLPPDILERLAKLRTSAVFSSDICDVLFAAEKEIRSSREKIETYQGVIMRRVLVAAAETPKEPTPEEIQIVLRDFVMPALKASLQNGGDFVMVGPAATGAPFLTCSACDDPIYCRGLLVCTKAADAGPQVKPVFRCDLPAAQCVFPVDCAKAGTCQGPI